MCEGRKRQHNGQQRYPSINALASFRSGVSNPSVNQPQIGARRSRASFCWPCLSRSFAKPSEACSSSDMRLALARKHQRLVIELLRRRTSGRRPSRLQITFDPHDLGHPKQLASVRRDGLRIGERRVCPVDVAATQFGFGERYQEKAQDRLSGGPVGVYRCAQFGETLLRLANWARAQPRTMPPTA